MAWHGEGSLAVLPATRVCGEEESKYPCVAGRFVRSTTAISTTAWQQVTCGTDANIVRRPVNCDISLEIRTLHWYKIK
jgi:hypothetical protein